MVSRSLSGYLREWGLMVAGLTMFSLSLPLYVSWSNRSVLDRWSYVYIIAMVVVTITWIGFIAVTWFRYRRNPFANEQNKPAHSKNLLSISIFCWGLAYMLSSLDSPSAAGRFTDLNILGSTVPSAAILEWIAILLFTIALVLKFFPRVSQRWQNSILVITTLVFLFVAGEGFARAKSILFPQPQGFPTYSGEMWYRKYVQVNTRGFRDEERMVQARDGIRRILVVGDSFTFGEGIQDTRNRFGEQFATLASRTGAGQWEAINAGLGDTHTLQHIDFLSRMLDLEPDLVVLIYVFNDIDYLAPVTPRDHVANSKMSMGRVLFLNSYMFQEIYVRLRKIILDGANEARFSAYNDDKLVNQHMADLSRFVSLAYETGAAVRIVPFAFNILEPEQIHYRRFIRQATDHGLPICSLEKAFGGHPVETLRVNSLDGHPNAFANGIAVEATFECLVDSFNKDDR